LQIHCLEEDRSLSVQYIFHIMDL